MLDHGALVLKLADNISEGYRTLRPLLRRSAAYLITFPLLEVRSYLVDPLLSAW